MRDYGGVGRGIGVRWIGGKDGGGTLFGQLMIDGARVLMIRVMMVGRGMG